MHGGELNILDYKFKNSINPDTYSKSTSKLPLNEKSKKELEQHKEEINHDDSRNKHIIDSMLKYHKLVNDTTINTRQRIKYRDLMYEELYKLNAVAERFGGSYSKKVLVATSLSRLGNGEAYFKQRAKDMNIKILENVQNMNDNELANKLNNLWIP